MPEQFHADKRANWPANKREDEQGAFAYPPRVIYAGFGFIQTVNKNSDYVYGKQVPNKPIKLLIKFSNSHGDIIANLSETENRGWLNG